MKLPKIYAQETKRMAIDMSLSENPLGCSPAVLTALKSLTRQDVSQYPNIEILRQAIAKRFGVKPNSVLLAAGSEQLIKLICQTLVKQGDRVLVQQGSFPLFTKEALLAGGSVTFVDLTKLKRIQNAKLIFLCSPNNPTGEVLRLEPLLKKISQLAPAALVVIDEANAEFSGQSFIPAAMKMNNCLILRTLSKAFGLAGLRVGFAIGSPPLMSRLRQTQQPFPITGISCQLALAALTDTAFLKQTINFVREERTFLIRQIIKLGLPVKPSQTNNLFIMSRDKRLIRELERQGVSVVGASFFPGLPDDGFRIAIQDKKTNRLFLKKLEESLACVNKKKLLRSKEVA